MNALPFAPTHASLRRIRLVAAIPASRAFVAPIAAVTAARGLWMARRARIAAVYAARLAGPFDPSAPSLRSLLDAAM
jgi:hypothetical protein